jgi:hypothetical protein
LVIHSWQATRLRKERFDAAHLGAGQQKQFGL